MALIFLHGEIRTKLEIPVDLRSGAATALVALDWADLVWRYRWGTGFGPSATDSLSPFGRQDLSISGMGFSICIYGSLLRSLDPFYNGEVRYSKYFSMVVNIGDDCMTLPQLQTLAFVSLEKVGWFSTRHWTLLFISSVLDRYWGTYNYIGLGMCEHINSNSLIC